MHAVILIDLATVLAHHGPALLYRGGMIPAESLQQYWVATRTRLDVWHRALSTHHQLVCLGDSSRVAEWWVERGPVMEELMLSEPLSRIYAALGRGLDRQSGQEEISPVTHAVYLSHLEARRRWMRILIDHPTGAPDQAERLNRLRLRVERWTDALLGQLAASGCDCTARYVFDRDRAQAFEEDTRQLPEGLVRETAGWLTSAAMRDGLMRHCRASPACPEMNRTVADSVLICLRPDLFDSVGRCKSLWLHRLEKGAEQAERVLESLDQIDISQSKILGGYEAVRSTGFGRW